MSAASIFGKFWSTRERACRQESTLAPVSATARVLTSGGSLVLLTSSLDEGCFVGFGTWMCVQVSSWRRSATWNIGEGLGEVSTHLIE